MWIVIVTNFQTSWSQSQSAQVTSTTSQSTLINALSSTSVSSTTVSNAMINNVELSTVQSSSMPENGVAPKKPLLPSCNKYDKAKTEQALIKIIGVIKPLYEFLDRKKFPDENLIDGKTRLDDRLFYTRGTKDTFSSGTLFCEQKEMQILKPDKYFAMTLAAIENEMDGFSFKSKEIWLNGKYDPKTNRFAFATGKSLPTYWGSGLSRPVTLPDAFNPVLCTVLFIPTDYDVSQNFEVRQKACDDVNVYLICEMDYPKNLDSLLQQKESLRKELKDMKTYNDSPKTVLDQIEKSNLCRKSPLETLQSLNTLFLQEPANTIKNILDSDGDLTTVIELIPDFIQDVTRAFSAQRNFLNGRQSEDELALCICAPEESGNTNVNNLSNEVLDQIYQLGDMVKNQNGSIATLWGRIESNIRKAKSGYSTFLDIIIPILGILGFVTSIVACIISTLKKMKPKQQPKRGPSLVSIKTKNRKSRSSNLSLNNPPSYDNSNSKSSKNYFVLEEKAKDVEKGDKKEKMVKFAKSPTRAKSLENSPRRSPRLAKLNIRRFKGVQVEPEEILNSLQNYSSSSSDYDSDESLAIKSIRSAFGVS